MLYATQVATSYVAFVVHYPLMLCARAATPDGTLPQSVMSGKKADGQPLVPLSGPLGLAVQVGRVQNVRASVAATD